jgi:hypothetical protein
VARAETWVSAPGGAERSPRGAVGGGPDRLSLFGEGFAQPDGRGFQCRTGGEAKKVGLLVGDGMYEQRITAAYDYVPRTRLPLAGWIFVRGPA